LLNESGFRLRLLPLLQRRGLGEQAFSCGKVHEEEATVNAPVTRR
jgi:hypothetical protein